MSPKLKDLFSIQEAMDNLATIGEINMEHPPMLGVVQDGRLVTDESEIAVGSIRWLSEEGEEPILEILDRTYRTIHRHLVSLFQNPETDWESKKFEASVAAMMSLVGESAVKMDRYLSFREGINIDKREKKIAQREEFRLLQQFYLEQFIRKFGDKVEGDEAWQEEWKEGSSLGTMSGLKDFETVRRDEEYELFYIRNENGEPYFNNELLRNIKLTADLESSGEVFEEDPLLKVRAIQDRDLQSSANQILGECHSQLDTFFKKGEKWKSNSFGKTLSMAVMALFLAANPRNLIQNTTGKSSLQYFLDFLIFLRASMETSEYQKWIAYPPERGEELAHLLLGLAHSLSFALFFRPGGVKQETIGLIHKAMRRGEEIFQASKKKILKGDSVWNEFLIEDERFRSFLAKFPNGPLFKILDIIREEEEENIAVPFDPILQENIPSKLYKIKGQKKQVEIVRIPSPVRQSQINHVEIVHEFKGFLRHLAKEDQKHLLINLNDRTSWREFERSKALENLQMNAEHSKHLLVVSLPKRTDFYYQNNEYLHLNRAEDFLAAILAQLKDPADYGFFIPSSWKEQDMLSFVEELLPLIHTHFFEGKANLTRRNREDFIEIFYQFFVLKMIDIFQPTSVSFSCKDAIDLGAAESGTFYGFVKLLNDDFSKKEEKDFLLWLYYTPALLIRERALSQDALNRSLSALERIDESLASSEDKILKAFGKLYQGSFLKELKAEHL